ncbi:MAG: hypothetical protein AAGI27_05205 [Pseudomonadota bacterium]
MPKTRHINTLSVRARWFYAVICFVAGSYPIAICLGYVTFEESDTATPLWVAAGVGSAFIMAGFMILLTRYGRANDLMAGVMLLIFASLGVWVSVFSSDAGFSGGVAWLPEDMNILIGRVFFGFGALVSLAMAVWAFRRAASGPKP